MTLASLFTDRMVLQANQPIKIFGEGKGKVKVTFCETTAMETFAQNEWCITLPEMSYGGPYEMHIELNKKRIILQDIYVGEVWLACGQSNMEMPLFRTEYGFEDAEHNQNNMIRFFTVPRREERNTPCYGHHFVKTHGYDTPWQLCTTDVALRFSAIGYHVAQELQKKLNVAIGVISCNWGGTLIEAHIKRDYFAKHPTLKYVWDEHVAFLESVDMENYLDAFNSYVQDWKNYYDSIKTDEIAITKELGIYATIGKKNTDLEEPFFQEGLTIATDWDVYTSLCLLGLFHSV